MLIRKFLNIELDKPIGIVDMATADTEVKLDIKQRILEEYRASKRPVITSESVQ